MNDIHTCSYSCERPECIKAQRDELVVRLEAQRDQASGNAEYLAYLEAAVDDAGFVIKHDGGTLGDSNFRLEPKTQPAAAQEAAGVDAYDDALDQLWKLAGGNDHPVYKRFLDFRDSFAAPVTAAPAGAIAAMALCANAEPQGTPEGWEKYWDATHAEPGIDLYPIRCALQYAAAAARENTHTEMAEGFDALIRKIDASPKGDT